MFNKIISFRLPIIILVLSILLVGISLSLYYYVSPVTMSDSEKLFILIAGFIPGLVVAIIQYIISWQEHADITKLKALRIKRILISRDDPAFYAGLIKKAKIEIKLMGVSGKRFLDDFASDGSPHEQQKVLLDALNRNVSVHLLIADEEQATASGALNNFKSTEPKLKELKEKYPSLFEYKYYSHTPIHSILIIDKECLLGSIFSHIKGKNTPSIHTVVDSDFAKPYVAYLKQEWVDGVNPA